MTCKCFLSGHDALCEKRASPTEIVGQVWDGMIMAREALALLDRQKIRGEFWEHGFLGYDYGAQRWVQILWPTE